jgi:hypothetical protein
MPIKTVTVLAAAILLGTTALAAAQNGNHHQGRNGYSRNMAAQRMHQRQHRYARNYRGEMAPYGQRFYDYAPGPYYDYAPGYTFGPGSYYYTPDYWAGIYGVAPDFSPGWSPYRGTPFWRVAPY